MTQPKQFDRTERDTLYRHTGRRVPFTSLSRLILWLAAFVTLGGPAAAVFYYYAREPPLVQSPPAAK